MDEDLKNKLNKINVILNNLERIGCEYTFNFVSTSGVVFTRTYISREKDSDLFIQERFDLVYNMRDIVDSIPIELINNLSYAFPHNKIQKVIGYKQLNNEKPNFNNGRQPNDLVFKNLNLNEFRNDKEDVDFYEEEIDGLSIEQKLVISDLNNKFEELIDDVSDQIGENASNEEIIRSIDTNKITSIITEFFEKFRENNISLNILSNQLKKRGIEITLYPPL